MNSPAIKNRILILLCVCSAGLIVLSGCGEILQKPKPEPFVGQNAPPPPKEFRWSNGDLPKTFDPAKAVVSPETDFVRAVFDGLTDLDAKTLKPVPAIAAQWESSEDFRTWTFHLRQNARWTNGKPITAADFARSWQRVIETGNKENVKLFQNIVGASLVQGSRFKVQSPALETKTDERPTTNNEQTWFGAEAADEFVLRVWLVEPDKDFPALAAHPAFRPVFESDAEFDMLESAAKIVTSGAFRVVSADKTGVALESSKNYWNARAVNLERVKIVPMKDPDAALAAYRAGELDAVTNAKFEPLAVKLLASYRDFRRLPFNAVTFYEFNPKRVHLVDRRVREALSLAVDRERLTADELDGAGAPARSLLPHSERSDDFRFDAAQARKLMAEAGFKDGKDFPKIKLLINRNDIQRRVARAVTAQWKENLGIETEIVMSSFEEIERAVDAGDFDIVRRARVLPTTDETANLQLMFETEDSEPESLQLSTETATNQIPPESAEQPEAPKIGGIEMPRLVPNEKDTSFGLGAGRPEIERVKILNEEAAVKEFPAIPLYYPLTYALVKPYVKNFETNLLDAPQLKAVEIESNWQR
ncbi:MAG: peptide ABC transporter substrate-binding protein [Acidobacteriota bacterium]|nr:peptide ABC transporter substrate-binding protein [Acidobacteriota bacterium]